MDATEILLGFARTLRSAGVDATPERVQTMLTATDALGTEAHHVYWAGRLTLCGEPGDLPIYDAAFAAYFGRATPPLRTVPTGVRRTGQLFGTSITASTDTTAELLASDTEVLRHRDLAQLTAAERDEVNRLLALLRPASPTRRSRRFAPASTGLTDRARTVRRMLRAGGELDRLAHRTHRTRPRRLVLLVDISGSMRPYADALLRFAHAAVRTRPASTEAFTIGTRLTRVTRELSHRDPDRALRASAHAIPDWSGGTRLGETLKAFLDRWGQRGTARQAIVVICSDGWERGDTTQLELQLRRLNRLAYKVIWVNPHRGKRGFAPLTAGMATALPYVDALVAGHTLQALDDLVSRLRS
jgi:uncharacterized protein with von Willebrand factor type A (vWA) domain